MKNEDKLKELAEKGDEQLLNLEALFEELLIEVEDYTLARSESVSLMTDKFNEIKKVSKEINRITKKYQKLISSQGGV